MELRLAPIELPPWFVPFVFDSGASCVMVNSSHHEKGWRDMDNSISITTADGGKLDTTKMGGTVSLLSFSPKTRQWEQMTYLNCLLIPSLVTNLIRMKSVMQNHSRVIFEDQLVMVQDRHGNVIHVHTSGDGYPAAAMMIWSDEMPEPAVSMAFAATMNVMDHAHKPCSKAELWHHRLGHASHDAIQHTQPVTLSHDIPSSPTPPTGILCDVCVRSKAVARNIAFPRSVERPLELVSMDVMGPLRGATKFTYVLIIHDAYSSMIWA
ncbi:hypothetical protein NDA11_003595 [Ustilago hordei]|nr:hypothetical protein NDA11_003595 [Ustilago hordei]